MIKRRAITNVDVLEDIYDEVKEIHIKYFPDQKFGAFIADLAEWIHLTTAREFGYINNSDMIKYVRDYSRIKGNNLTNLK